SSMMRQGTLPSGLYCWILESCSQTFSRTNSYSSFFSASTTRVLRTYGLVNEPISFMATFEGWGGQSIAGRPAALMQKNNGLCRARMCLWASTTWHLATTTGAKQVGVVESACSGLAPVSSFEARHARIFRIDHFECAVAARRPLRTQGRCPAHHLVGSGVHGAPCGSRGG